MQKRQDARPSQRTQSGENSISTAGEFYTGTDSHKRKKKTYTRMADAIPAIDTGLNGVLIMMYVCIQSFIRPKSTPKYR